MKWIDISMSLNSQTPPWPGDEPFQYKLTWAMEDTGSVNVGQFQASNHIGTHIDAPFHYDSNGEKAASLPLDRFAGDVLVINMENKDKISAADLEPFDYKNVEKVIFRTLSWKDRSVFPSSYTVIGEDAGPFLKQKGVHLIGIDTPSVDPETSKDLPGHHSLYGADILILEGLVLDHVAPGIYELAAFPLKMEDADGSPVRAVLKQKS
ncbi:arylformamidase [Halobacillus massiliensis]|uniref:arylformamidase n=1 Tax=Halobacillus massiliensis TaxID=1926286 RepID=UPI0009E2586F|nr:arylformamidase [Halobacillus massiliensis]